MSQSGLAKKSGIKLRAIQCYEQRTRDIDGARLGTLLDLCLALNCTIRDVLEDEENIRKFDCVFIQLSTNNQSAQKEKSEKDTLEQTNVSGLDKKDASKDMDANEYLFAKFFDNERLSELTDDQRAGISFLIEGFSQKWKRVLELRLVYKLPLAEISKELDITAERVRQIILRATERLEKFNESEYVTLGLKATRNKRPEKKEECSPLDRDIKELGLSGRAYNCLMRAGLDTVGSVVLSQKNLIDIKKIGRGVSDEINEKIDAYMRRCSCEEERKSV